MGTPKSYTWVSFQRSGPRPAPRLPRGSIWGAKWVFWGAPGVCFRRIFYVLKHIINVKFRFQALTSEHSVVAYQL